MSLRLPGAIGAVRQYLRDVFATVAAEPVIVLGNQKSGTSAIAHLLADAGGLSKTIDIPALWPPAGAEILRGHARFADVVRRHKSSFAAGVIKEPWMTFFAEQVIERFPRAAYVFVVRDPRDNIRSFLNRRSIPGNRDRLPDGSLPAQWRQVAFDPELWGGEGENYIGVLAHRWNKAARAYLDHRDRMVLAKYEEFEADKVGFIRQLAEAVGVTPSHDISARVDTPYQRPGNRDVTWDDFFGEANRRRIEAICAPGMTSFGYRLEGGGAPKRAAAPIDERA